MIVASNQKVLAQLNAARAVMNGACSFRLFSNNFTPSPASLITDFVESSFPGYLRLNTVGTFGIPFKVLDGLYQVDGGPYLFSVTADSIQFVYGWWIVLGGQVLYSSRFIEPIAALNGTPISILFSLQEGSLSLCNLST